MKSTETRTHAETVAAVAETRARYEYRRMSAPRARMEAERAAAEAVDAVRALETPARLDALAEWIENAREAERVEAEKLAEARREYLAARAALTVADLPAYVAADGRNLADLAAASVSRAIDRREAETGRHGATLRAKYAEDARQEAAALMLSGIYGDPDRPDRPAWIDGDPVAIRDRETGETVETPREAAPLAYYAAIMAGKALDRLMYADGGHAAKLTAREARENYRNAPELRDLADLADVLADEAEETRDPETVAAAKAARAEYLAAVRVFAARATVTETRRTVDPVAPSPVTALLTAERVARILEGVAGEATRKNAVALSRAFYEGAENLTEAADLADLPRRTARDAWQAVRNSAAVVLYEDGESAALERLIDSDRETLANVARRAESARVAREAARIAATPARDPSAVRFTMGRPDRLAKTAKLSPADLAALRDFARAVFHEAATR